MYLALTYDHRILDGREAVTFLVKVRRRAKSQFLGLFTDPFHRSKSTSRTLAACFSAKQADLGIVVHNRLHGLKYGTLTSRYFYSVASGFFCLFFFFLSFVDYRCIRARHISAILNSIHFMFQSSMGPLGLK